ncbi:hypothetical protein [Desulfuribacillus alkaliarsenatis]|uniref:Uncharacterized protein n=1 Tax=Desulfuribacillus alkaliarsenatis TaxID=766136 RepID=A0A1E5FYJ4_9FIRM|nr:hypothetical protein [Desulfuribacillus alkaliarsenatis]OEF95645.1 hypothetical protein BHF68_12435 [Desulfuribacillus alkaliarsenatis]
MVEKLDLILSELQKLNSRVTYIEANMATKKDIEDIPFIRQAVLETSEMLSKFLTTISLSMKL